MTNVVGMISQSCALVIGACSLVIPFPPLACDNFDSCFALLGLFWLGASLPTSLTVFFFFLLVFMNPLVLLTYYCLLILGASIVGGMIPVWFRLTHRVMECAVSFVAGVMLGVGLLHMLPHALQQTRAAASSPTEASDLTVMLWVLAGLMTMFFIERFFCFHHHEVEDGEVTCHHEHDSDHKNGHAHGHGHDITWSGAALGLTLHSVIAGVALAASVQHGHGDLRLAGLGTFLVILLHKPFDSMTIATLMARGGWSLGWRHLVNAVFSLAIPLGAAIFHVGIVGSGKDTTLGYALAFAAGTFMRRGLLCALH